MNPAPSPPVEAQAPRPSLEDVRALAPQLRCEIDGRLLVADPKSGFAVGGGGAVFFGTFGDDEVVLKAPLSELVERGAGEGRGEAPDVAALARELAYLHRIAERSCGLFPAPVAGLDRLVEVQVRPRWGGEARLHLLVAERVHGLPFAHACSLRGRPVSRSESWRAAFGTLIAAWWRDIVRGFGALLDDGCVYADIAPDNLLVGEGDGRLRILDAGSIVALGRGGSVPIRRSFVPAGWQDHFYPVLTGEEVGRSEVERLQSGMVAKMLVGLLAFRVCLADEDPPAAALIGQLPGWLVALFARALGQRLPGDDPTVASTGLTFAEVERALAAAPPEPGEGSRPARRFVSAFPYGAAARP